MSPPPAVGWPGGGEPFPGADDEPVARLIGADVAAGRAIVPSPAEAPTCSICQGNRTPRWRAGWIFRVCLTCDRPPRLRRADGGTDA